VAVNGEAVLLVTIEEIYYTTVPSNKLHGVTSQKAVVSMFSAMITLLKAGSLSNIYAIIIQSQWPRGLRRRSAAARLLRLCSNPTGGMDVCRESSVLSGRVFCDGLITRPEESYRLLCAVV